jgi:hypothetical protein
LNPPVSVSTELRSGLNYNLVCVVPVSVNLRAFRCHIFPTSNFFALYCDFRKGYFLPGNNSSKGPVQDGRGGLPSGRRPRGVGLGVSSRVGGVWEQLGPSPEYIFFTPKIVHFGAYFAQFYGRVVDDLLLAQFMFYSGLL